MKILKVEQTVCPQCKALDFILKAIPEVNSLVRKVNIDHDLDADLIERFGTINDFIDHFEIMGTPTLLFLNDDYEELDRIVGAKGITPDVILEKYHSLL